MTSDADSLRLLAEVGPLVASAVDTDQALARIGGLAVEYMADLCIIDVAEPDGTFRRAAVAARDPAGARARLGDLGTVWRWKETVLWPSPSPEQIERLAPDPDERRLLESIGVRSLIAVPVLAKGRLLGGMVLISSHPWRLYAPREARLAEALAQRAALALDNAQLHRAAERASAAREQLVGLMAHDLRNPLYNILLNAEILSRAVQPGGTPIHAVERIIRSATRMNRLIEDLMDVSRIDGPGLAVERRVLRVEDLLMDSFDAQRAQAVSASVALRVELSRPVGCIWADRDRLLQALDNLIANALRFTPGGGDVVVGAGLRESDVRFWVRDTGQGMSPEALNHVFDRFWHARRTGRAAAGLGLAIVKGIVEAHGGRLSVVSSLGQGTTVAFTLPAAAAEPEPADGDEAVTAPR